MQSNFEKILNHSKTNQAIIAIFQDASNADFWAGYIVDYNDEYFVMQHITKYGKLDGLIIEPIYKIRRIDQDEYCKCLQYIWQHNKELDIEDQAQLNVPKEENWIYHTLLQISENSESLARISVGNDSRFAGFVTEVSEIDFTLKCIGHDGQDEGYIYFLIEDINSFRINDLEARRRLMLYNFRQSVDFFL